MMSSFRGGGGSKMTPKYRIIERKKIGLWGVEGGVKNDPKKSDIIYGCSLSMIELDV